MYDLDGSDTDREWIEIQNTGSVSVDISGYKLREANTNHSLSVSFGSATIPASGFAVIAVTQPKCPFHNPNPTFVRTWSDLFFVEVDLTRVAQLRSTRNEPIYSAEYITVPELLRRIREGKDEAGGLYRMCTANSLWLIFFATFPELFVAT